MKIPPFACVPVLKQKVWGGQTLRTRLEKPVPDNTPIGESWELSGYGSDISTVADGPLAGRSLTDLAAQYGQQLLGPRSGPELWPLLYKFIDARDKLSVQVHPNDDEAVRFSWDVRGKTECWYIVDAAPDATIIVGVREGVTLEALRQGVVDGNLRPLLNEIPIAAGDVLYVPAGTVHAIMADTLLYEVQETSDITLRLYDWGRMGLDGKPRDLHVEDSLKVIRPLCHDQHRIPPLNLTSCTTGVRRALRAACRYFALEQFQWDTPATASLPPVPSFRVLTCVAGSGIVSTDGGTGAFSLGDTLLVPADADAVALEGSQGCSVLLSWVPDLRSEVVLPALEAGVEREALAATGGYAEFNDLLPVLEAYESR